MTIREFYDNLLSELNKVEAPSLLLEDFIYFANKAVQQYVNKVYNRYDINQQSTDDLRVLKNTTKLDVQDLPENESEKTIMLPTESAYWYVELPSDYLHILNCVVQFVKKGSALKKCADKKMKSPFTTLARRLTSDMYPSIMNNAYFKPSYKVPYYFINEYNVVKSNALLDYALDHITDPCGTHVMENNYDGSLKLEIRCGDTSIYQPKYVFIDYIRTPKRITLKYEQLESEEDMTEILEFPEYVCYEILNECVKLVMENSSDPRLQTNIPINQTIGNNVQQTK